MEVAIAVDDEWQGRGIGRRLMSELIGRACTEGLARLVAYVSSDNHVGARLDRVRGGTAEYARVLGDALRHLIATATRRKSATRPGEGVDALRPLIEEVSRGPRAGRGAVVSRSHCDASVAIPLA